MTLLNIYNKMTFTSIYKKVKPGLVKGVKPVELLSDIDATAWQYAFQCLKNRRITSIRIYNEIFMDLYTQAQKVLRKVK